MSFSALRQNSNKKFDLITCKVEASTLFRMINKLPGTSAIQNNNGNIVIEVTPPQSFEAKTKKQCSLLTKDNIEKLKTELPPILLILSKGGGSSADSLINQMERDYFERNKNLLERLLLKYAKKYTQEKYEKQSEIREPMHAGEEKELVILAPIKDNLTQLLEEHGEKQELGWKIVSTLFQDCNIAKVDIALLPEENHFIKNEWIEKLKQQKDLTLRDIKKSLWNYCTDNGNVIQKRRQEIQAKSKDALSASVSENKPKNDPIKKDKLTAKQKGEKFLQEQAQRKNDRDIEEARKLTDKKNKAQTQARPLAAVRPARSASAATKPKTISADHMLRLEIERMRAAQQQKQPVENKELTREDQVVRYLHASCHHLERIVDILLSEQTEKQTTRAHAAIYHHAFLYHISMLLEALKKSHEKGLNSLVSVSFLSFASFNHDDIIKGYEAIQHFGLYASQESVKNLARAIVTRALPDMQRLQGQTGILSSHQQSTLQLADSLVKQIGKLTLLQDTLAGKEFGDCFSAQLSTARPSEELKQEAHKTTHTTQVVLAKLIDISLIMQRLQKIYPVCPERDEIQKFKAMEAHCGREIRALSMACSYAAQFFSVDLCADLLKKGYPDSISRKITPFLRFIQACRSNQDEAPFDPLSHHVSWSRLNGLYTAYRFLQLDGQAVQFSKEEIDTLTPLLSSYMQQIEAAKNNDIKMPTPLDRASNVPVVYPVSNSPSLNAESTPSTLGYFAHQRSMSVDSVLGTRLSSSGLNPKASPFLPMRNN